MIYTLKNEALTVQIDTKGAEVRSVKAADGTEFMWQADTRYWGKTAPWMFPICGRLADTYYTYRGVRYELPRHGFARDMGFAVTAATDDALTFTLTANAETKKVYPFDFSFEITYRLVGNRLDCTLCVANLGTEPMLASFGGHPGFSVPLGGAGEYDDWKLVFGEPCAPRAVVFTPDMLDSGTRVPFPLQNVQEIPLSRAFFLHDATFLCDVAPTVTLCSDKSAHAVTLSYGKVPYLGIWSAANGGDFVCVEPWYGMASLEGVTALEEKGDMREIAVGEAFAAEIALIFH
ncbi:MAG: aldose 1-epimerase family protein [Clostridia bacterium]|nr:aldose 1-epimerase family protein [Clostridia bacterium]